MKQNINIPIISIFLVFSPQECTRVKVRILLKTFFLVLPKVILVKSFGKLAYTSKKKVNPRLKSEMEIPKTGSSAFIYYDKMGFEE